MVKEILLYMVVVFIGLFMVCILISALPIVLDSIEEIKERFKK